VIERGLREGLKPSQIAALIGKHRTTVVREINRGAGRD
jgi:IS30 family transposase